MFCCAKCFGDSFLEKQIIPKLASQNGICQYCTATNVALVEPIKLIDYFQAVCSIYSADNGTDSKLLTEWFQDDWQVFTGLDSVKATALLGEILNDVEIVRKKHVPRVIPSMATIEKWASFRDEIMSKNRFFVNHEIDLARLKELFETYLQTDSSPFGDKFFRARVQNDDKTIPLSKMGKPPVKEVKNGRANPVGIPYLYAATTPETAIAETRPHPGDKLCVARFVVSSPLRLLNLLHPRTTISPFEIEERALPELRYDLSFLCHLENELSKPILPRVADLEYLPTQYLCEFIKNCGYDGVLFKSSISTGANLALFDDTKVRANKLMQYQVTKLQYEQVPLAD